MLADLKAIPCGRTPTGCLESGMPRMQSRHCITIGMLFWHPRHFFHPKEWQEECEKSISQSINACSLKPEPPKFSHCHCKQNATVNSNAHHGAQCGGSKQGMREDKPVLGGLYACEA